jgi:hypothetical protein
MVGRIATGELTETLPPEDDGKDKGARALGRKGGNARAESLSKKRCSEIARQAADKRWRKGQWT